MLSRIIYMVLALGGQLGRKSLDDVLNLFSNVGYMINYYKMVEISSVTDG